MGKEEQGKTRPCLHFMYLTCTLPPAGVCAGTAKIPPWAILIICYLRNTLQLSLFPTVVLRHRLLRSATVGDVDSLAVYVARYISRNGLVIFSCLDQSAVLACTKSYLLFVSLSFFFRLTLQRRSLCQAFRSLYESQLRPTLEAYFKSLTGYQIKFYTALLRQISIVCLFSVRYAHLDSK